MDSNPSKIHVNCEIPDLGTTASYPLPMNLMFLKDSAEKLGINARNNNKRPQSLSLLRSIAISLFGCPEKVGLVWTRTS